MEKKKNNFRDKAIASVGAGIAAAAGKEVGNVSANSGFALGLENKLHALDINKMQGARHVASFASKIPASVLNSVGTLAVYDGLTKTKNGEDPTFKRKFAAGLGAAAASTALTSPLYASTQKIPIELEKSIGNSYLKKLRFTAKNRAIQSAIAAPVGLITYDSLRPRKHQSDKEQKIRSVVAGPVASMAATATTSVPTAMYEALAPKYENAASGLSSRLISKFPYLAKKFGKSTAGHVVARAWEGTLKRLPAVALGSGFSYIAYDQIKKKLNKDHYE